MSRIRSKNSKPEKTVRAYLFSKGVRYRLHRKDLPGRPDITISRVKTVVFMNGCFWHHHEKCKSSHWPKSNVDYWKPKIGRNIERDKQVYTDLGSQGWRVVVVWECEVDRLEEHQELNGLVSEYKGTFSLKSQD